MIDTVHQLMYKVKLVRFQVKILSDPAVDNCCPIVSLKIIMISKN